MRNFIHKAGTPELEVIEHDDATSIREVAAQHGAEGEALVFINDGEESADSEQTLAEAGVGDDDHIHVARCRRVTATVNFKEDSRSRKFPPNAAMIAVFEWAAGPKGFKLSPTDKAEHMLVITGTETAADEDAHLEAYASDECTAEFDLVPKHRFEG
ncbi:MAG TPA: hypothetical protein VK488_15180 [Gaiellaceae bacterium]|nr:hypothetical protein [Gaiellaceae bacterium]